MAARLAQRGSISLTLRNAEKGLFQSKGCLLQAQTPAFFCNIVFRSATSAALEPPTSRRSSAVRPIETARPTELKVPNAPATDFHRPLKEIMRELKRPVPEDILKRRREADGTELTYVPWHAANRMLDFYAPGWQGEVRSVSFGPQTVTVVYRITITGSDGEIFREATGTETLSSSFSGPDPVQMAEQMAFRRAAARFGLGLDLYGSAI